MFTSHLNVSLRRDLRRGEWVRCNERIQGACQCPMFGLQEGTVYQFRVCAVNRAGAGRPSKATEPVLAADPLRHTRTTGTTAATTPPEDTACLVLSASAV